MQPDEFDKYYTKALRFLTIRPRSEKEVRDNLIKKNRGGRSSSEKTGEVEKIIDQVIEKLKAQKFLKDEEFAKWWVEQRVRFRPRSMRLIKIELRQKEISNEILESGIVNNESSEETNDKESARKIVQAKIHRYKGLSKFELTQKLGPLLARKGFDYDTIKEAIDEVWKEEYNTG